MSEVHISREQQADLDPILNRAAVQVADPWDGSDLVMAAYKLGRQHAAMTPWQADRASAERTGAWQEGWGPFHRHFANDAIHRDGGRECDQPGTPRRVYVFDDDYLREHELAVGRWAIAHPERFGGEPPGEAPRPPGDSP